jgi:hypothetical protein
VFACQDISAAQTINLAHIRTAIDGQYDCISFRSIFRVFVHYNEYAFAGAAAHYGAPQHFHFWMHDRASYTLLLVGGIALQRKRCGACDGRASPSASI